eukprot:CAMPEP_0203764260 /NCGR_PEP_ID=MMETSP0098-20131031/17558_1 /ASSEMBLY_ACC=CAM_ASM_000208 /TAXON_ID=96639 /ORGANISM=" , Strain NY0313808BC1" /LENGTH=401 /DNA_ID=CAMNT_0050660043 /DNA_START=1746 /DNA_END=2948 /DNA_ORIENTATION=+
MQEPLILRLKVRPREIKRRRVEVVLDDDNEVECLGSRPPCQYGFRPLRMYDESMQRVDVGGNFHVIDLGNLVCGKGLEEAWISALQIQYSRLIKHFPALEAVDKLVITTNEKPGLTDEDRDKFRSNRGSTGKSLTEIQCPTNLPPYGCNHSKYFILFYKDRVRVIILTANLIDFDLLHKAEGVWYQDFSKKAHQQPQVDNLFGRTLEAYFRKLFAGSSTENNRRISLINSFDYSTSNASLIASIPGNHNDDSVRWGQHALRWHLRNLPKEQRRWPVVCQCTSFGSQKLKGGKCWLLDEFVLKSVQKEPQDVDSETYVVYPSNANASKFVYSHNYYAEGLFCKDEVFNDQRLRPTFCSWIPSTPLKKPCMPHIKSYCSYDPKDPRKLAWCVLTSSNASKAAW